MLVPDSGVLRQVSTDVEAPVGRHVRGDVCVWGEDRADGLGDGPGDGERARLGEVPHQRRGAGAHVGVVHDRAVDRDRGDVAQRRGPPEDVDDDGREPVRKVAGDVREGERLPPVEVRGGDVEDLRHRCAVAAKLALLRPVSLAHAPGGGECGQVLGERGDRLEHAAPGLDGGGPESGLDRAAVRGDEATAVAGGHLRDGPHARGERRGLGKDRAADAGAAADLAVADGDRLIGRLHHDVASDGEDHVVLGRDDAGTSADDADAEVLGVGGLAGERGVAEHDVLALDLGLRPADRPVAADEDRDVGVAVPRLGGAQAGHRVDLGASGSRRAGVRGAGRVRCRRGGDGRGRARGDESNDGGCHDRDDRRGPVAPAPRAEGDPRPHRAVSVALVCPHAIQGASSLRQWC
nr:hypothetical protein [Xylanimonas allomyrinae]